MRFPSQDEQNAALGEDETRIRTILRERREHAGHEMTVEVGPPPVPPMSAVVEVTEAIDPLEPPPPMPPPHLILPYCTVCGKQFNYKTVGMTRMQMDKHRQKAHPIEG